VVSNAPSSSRRGGGSSGGIGAARKVTPQRKQNNRKAQQRYREKRKAQAADMEQRVSALTSELEALQTVKARAEAVTGENEQLRLRLQEQAEQIEQLKVRRRLMCAGVACVGRTADGVSHACHVFIKAVTAVLVLLGWLGWKKCSLFFSERLREDTWFVGRRVGAEAVMMPQQSQMLS
jgi:Basic region leucine zipper